MYNPYSKGRWYRLFLESDGTTTKITDKDIDVTLMGANLKFPVGFHIIDNKLDINCIEHDAVVSIVPNILGYADGAEGIAGPVAKAFDWAYIYVFGYYA